MTELNASTLSQLPPKVAVSSYDRSRLSAESRTSAWAIFTARTGLYYIDCCLALPGQEDWDIVVSHKAAQFCAQDCLYSLTIAPPNDETSVRVVAAPISTFCRRRSSRRGRRKRRAAHGVRLRHRGLGAETRGRHQAVHGGVVRQPATQRWRGGHCLRRRRQRA
jgi:hypothetical protein